MMSLQKSENFTFVRVIYSLIIFIGKTYLQHLWGPVSSCSFFLPYLVLECQVKPAPVGKFPKMEANDFPL